MKDLANRIKKEQPHMFTPKHPDPKTQKVLKAMREALTGAVPKAAQAFTKPDVLPGLRDRYMVIGGKSFWLSRITETPCQATGKAMIRLLQDENPPLLDEKAAAKVMVEEAPIDRRQAAAKAHAACWRAVAGVLQSYNQASAMVLSVDVFATEFSSSMGSATVADQQFIAAYPLPALKAKAKPVPAIVADFKEHFPEFDDLLDLIGHARAAPSRKQCFVWMRAGSNYGKSLLLAALAEAGVLLEFGTDSLADLMAGKPSGFSAGGITSAWVIAVEEFHHVNSDLKKLSDSVTVNAKYMPCMHAALYTKLFTSAEDVRALTGDGSGIEAQFLNRFNYIDCLGRGALPDRPLFQKVGKDAYKRALADYIARRLQTIIDNLRAMGRDAGTLAAEAAVNRFNDKYPLSVLGDSLDDGLAAIAEDMREVIQLFVERGDDTCRPSARLRALPAGALTVLHVNVRVGEYDGQAIIHVARPKELVMAMLNSSKSKLYKAGQIAELLTDVVNWCTPESGKIGRKMRLQKIPEKGNLSVKQNDRPFAGAFILLKAAPVLDSDPFG